MVRRFSLTSSILLITLAVGLYRPSYAAEEIELLTKYFDFLVGGNHESAAYLWHEGSQERASRFGIEYTGIPLKADCGSPVVRNLTLMRNFLQPPARMSERLIPADYMRLEYSQVVNSQEVRHDYYVHMDGGYYWLIYPQDYYCRDYKIILSKYFRVHYANESKGYLHPAVLADADSFVDRIADSLHISADGRHLLEQEKIDYFYVASDSIVKSIVGFPVQGTYDLASDDIISSTFPHYHELTHFLVNYSLRTLPLYTLPVFREGIAVAYGGRWGKAASPLFDLGKFLYDQQITEVDSVLTMSGFEGLSGSDIAYPIGGAFCAFLIGHAGSEKFWQIYRNCSGDIDSLSRLTPIDIQERIIQVTGDSTWGQLQSGFIAYLKGREGARTLLPGSVEGGKKIAEVGAALIAEAGDWITVDISLADTAGSAASLFFGRDKKLAAGRSSLFETQFKDGVPFEGYHWALRLDRNEAGIYDYVGNQLTAKYIYSMAPDSAYLATDGKTVRVRFHKDLIGGKFPAAADMKLLNR